MVWILYYINKRKQWKGFRNITVKESNFLFYRHITWCGKDWLSMILLFICVYWPLLRFTVTESMTSIIPLLQKSRQCALEYSSNSFDVKKHWSLFHTVYYCAWCSFKILVKYQYVLMILQHSVIFYILMARCEKSPNVFLLNERRVIPR